MKKSTLIAFAMLLIVLALNAGCASFRYAAAKDNYITNEMQNFAYDEASPSELIAQARALLTLSGYMIIPDSHRNNYLETDWAATSETDRRRYVVSAFTTSTGTQITFEYVNESRSNIDAQISRQSGRDHIMEYTLLKRVDYPAWQAIENAANQYANQAAAK